MPLYVNHALMDSIRMEQPVLNVIKNVLNAQLWQLALLARLDTT